MNFFIRKIISPAEAGMSELFHTPNAVQKSGWRDFPREKDRARFDAQVRKCAAGKARNSPLAEAVTALIATCPLDLSLPKERDFLRQSLWEVWQAGGGCYAYCILCY